MYTVYCLFCLATGREYFGSTKNLEYRVKMHLAYLFEYARHPNKELQADALAFDEADFEVRTIRRNLSKTRARALEVRLIHENPLCYNVIKSTKPIRKNNGGSRCPTATVRASAWAFLTKAQVQEIKDLSTEFYGYELAQKFGVSPSTITKVLNGTYGHNGLNIKDSQ